MAEEIVDIGPECFAGMDFKVISFKGENYYRACGFLVSGIEDEGQSFCVKRVDHPGNIHEDFDGNTYEDFEVKHVISMDLKHKDITSSVYECVGAASACWENLEGAGVFLEDRARDISEQLLHRIHDEMPHHDGDTITKVYHAIWDAMGVDKKNPEAEQMILSSAIVSELQNAGILFRERVKSDG